MFKPALVVTATALALALGTSALAQMTPTPSGPGQSGAMTADQLNGHVAHQVQMRDDARAQARRDRMAFRAASMRRYHLSVERYQTQYARREAAYADAMAAWRGQVYACHHGHDSACRAPTPRVSDFY